MENNSFNSVHFIELNITNYTLASEGLTICTTSLSQDQISDQRKRGNRRVSRAAVLEAHFSDKKCVLKHIQLAQYTQSVTSGEMSTVFKLADKIAAIVGTVSEMGNI